MWSCTSKMNVDAHSHPPHFSTLFHAPYLYSFNLKVRNVLSICTYTACSVVASFVRVLASFQSISHYYSLLKLFHHSICSFNASCSTYLIPPPVAYIFHLYLVQNKRVYFKTYLEIILPHFAS